MGTTTVRTVRACGIGDAVQLQVVTMIARQGSWLTAKVAEALVMMNSASGQYFELGEVGGRIWDLLETPQNLEALCAQLGREYCVAPEVCRSDVEAFLNDLAERGAVSLQSSTL